MYKKMSVGYIYIFTNSSLKKGVMVGYTTNWKTRLQNINQSTILASDFKPYLIYETNYALSETDIRRNVFEILFQGLKLYDDMYDIKRRKAKKLILSIARINGEESRVTDQEQNEEELANESSTLSGFSEEAKLDDADREDIEKMNEEFEDAETNPESLDDEGIEEGFIGLDEFCQKVNVENPNGFEPTECHFLNRMTSVSSIKEIVEFVLLTLYSKSMEKFKEACSKAPFQNYISFSCPNQGNFTKAPGKIFYYKSNLFKREMFYLFERLSMYMGYPIITGGLLFRDKSIDKDEYDTEPINEAFSPQNSNETNDNDEEKTEDIKDEVKYTKDKYTGEKEHININENINFERTIACGLMYQGRTYETNDGLYSELIDQIINVFPKIPEEKIATYISNEQLMYIDSKYISPDSFRLGNPHKLGDYPFYIEEDITPSQAIKFIRYYASQGGVDPSSFEIIVGR